jgi:hypothetical protein
MRKEITTIEIIKRYIFDKEKKTKIFQLKIIRKRRNKKNRFIFFFFFFFFFVSY